MLSTHNPQEQHTPSLIIDQLLGAGKFSVYHARLSSKNDEYALKLFPQDFISHDTFKHEKNVLKELNHPNIIRYISKTKIDINHKETNVLVLEYASYGDFFDLMASRRLTDECLIRHYFHELITGLEYLHSKKIAHSDIKLENLLLGENFMLKVTDFDQATTLKDKLEPSLGTSGYRAPEVLEGKCKDIFAADIYSAGVTLFVLVTGEMPFEETEQEGRSVLLGSELFYKYNERFWKERIIRCKNPILLNKSFQNLVNGMLVRDPEKRLKIKEIKASQWYEGCTYDEEAFLEKMEKLICESYQAKINKVICS